MKKRPPESRGNGAAALPGLMRIPCLLILLFIAGALYVSPAAGAANPLDELPKVLHVAFSSRTFPGVELSDAQIAMELWARELSRNAGIPKARVTIFNDVNEIREAVRHGNIHMVTMPPVEFLKYRRELKIVPAYVAANKSGKDMENLIVVRRDSGMQTVRDLRGRTLAMASASHHGASLIWLNVLSMREGAGQATGFFRRLHETKNASQAVIGVFFRKFDGALVTRASLEACSSVNPQLDRELAVIAKSDSLVGDISCLPVNIGEKLRIAIDTAALTLHEKTVGRQMATLFQVNRVAPFKPSYLSGLEELLRERDRLAVSQRKKR